MAMGSTYNGGSNNKTDYRPDISSPMQFANPEGVDPTKLTFGFWSGFMKINISPKLPQAGPNGEVQYDWENQITYYLSPQKAKLLLEDYENFKNNKDNCKSFGVESGKRDKMISITKGIEYGLNTPLLVIRLMGEKEEVLSSYAYQFKDKVDDYRVVRNFDEKTGKYDIKQFDGIELEMFMNAVQQYYESASYAIAGTVIDTLRFNQKAVVNRVDTLLEHFNLKQSNSSRGQGSGRKGSFFQNGNDSSKGNTSSASLSDLDEDDPFA